MPTEDIRVLIPRVRRAVEGVGTPQVLTPDQIKDLIADAVADVILFTGGLWGHELIVTARDPITGSASEYATSEPLTLAEGSVIAAQAALTHVFQQLKELKVQETIRDEGQEWSYTISAQALRDYLKFLQGQRDLALAEVEAQHPIPTAFVSFLHERDALVARAVEPFVLPR